jgi:hypothetical protein
MMSDSNWRLDNARWRFLASIDHSGSASALQWRWRAIAANAVTWEGDEWFPDADACRADAAKHGFQVAARGVA